MAQERQDDYILDVTEEEISIVLGKFIVRE